MLAHCGRPRKRAAGAGEGPVFGMSINPPHAGDSRWRSECPWSVLHPHLVGAFTSRGEAEVGPLWQPDHLVLGVHATSLTGFAEVVVSTDQTIVSRSKNRSVATVTDDLRIWLDTNDEDTIHYLKVRAGIRMFWQT